ncbi:MAG: sulfotransferase domain-containing protein [Candidatus Brocadiaceae bacterium]|nr:sulfotransferase domain-containing protein [Candidatus Brocadiaceae bacterium]
MPIRLPNFLIVGAPKCGTTSIASCMNQHPDIYISPIKEPKFITAQFIRFPLKGPGDDFVENFTVKNFELYKKLFRKVKQEKAIGDASVDNLFFYKQAIPVIRNFLGDVKIIIVLRKPQDRAFSAYKNMLRDLRETLSFEEALEMETKRKQQNYEYLWLYKEVGFYYQQVKAYFEDFSQVKVFILEEFKNNNLGLLRQIFSFLEVDPDFIPARNMNLNVSGAPRYRCIQWFFKPTGFKGRMYKYSVMNGIPQEMLFTWIEILRHMNIQQITMKAATKNYLTNLYQKDILKLEKVLKKDLSRWLE